MAKAKTKRRIFWSAWLFMFAAAGWLACHLGLPTSYALGVLSLLGDSAGILFGVFGVWLGICYRADIDTCLDRDGREFLRDRARDVLATAERCRILFTGLAISSVIFVFSLFVRFLFPVASVLAGDYPCFVKFARYAFFILVSSCVLAQIYSILTPVAITAEAIAKVKRAKDGAEFTLGSTFR